MARARSPLSDEDLLAVLRREEQAASAYQQGTLSALREKALAYYDRQPYGDEQEGSSQVVTSEFADVVESLMPGLMRVFTAADDLVRFAPMQPGQEKAAAEASGYVPHVLMRQNDGFRIVSALLKDALMYRLGGVTVDVEEIEDRRALPVQGLPQDAIDLVVAAAEREGMTVTLDLSRDAAPPPGVIPSGSACPERSRREGPRFSQHPTPGHERLSGTIILTRCRQRVVVDSIAPEDIRFTPGARTEDDASFLGYIKRTTASDLAKLGLTAEEIDALAADRPTPIEEDQRNDGLVDTSERDTTGDSERPLWLVVAYIRVDADGDGISERQRVVYARGGGSGHGDGGRIIERLPWDGPPPIALATPILMPHTLVGRSLFDQTQDLQQIGSVLTRGLLDNLYLVNRPRPVISDHVNLDSLIDWTPGAPIRLRAGARPADNHVSWLQVPNVSAGALTALEYMGTVRENRTGVSRYNQGLDSDSLNKTLGGIDRIMSASTQRQDLIARVFAETAMKRLYRLVYRAVRRAATGPVAWWPGRGDAFAACDPSQWPEDLDLSVDVVGIGNREQALGHLSMIGNAQEKLIALQGGRADGPFVTAENVSNVAQKLAETLGYRTPGVFFQSPARAAAGPSTAPQTSTPDPTIALAEAEIALRRTTAEAEIDLKRRKAHADMAIAAFKARQWAAIERFKAGLVREQGPPD